jgi:hypothetical protein
MQGRIDSSLHFFLQKDFLTRIIFRECRADPCNKSIEQTHKADVSFIVITEEKHFENYFCSAFVLFNRGQRFRANANKRRGGSRN